MVRGETINTLYLLLSSSPSPPPPHRCGSAAILQLHQDHGRLIGIAAHHVAELDEAVVGLERRGSEHVEVKEGGKASNSMNQS